MKKSKVKIIDLVAMGGFLIIVLVLVILRRQTILYDIVGNSDSTIALEPGKGVMQTYSPNRRDITEFDFKLAKKSFVTGEYTLVITDDTPDSKEVFNITNKYEGELVDSIKYRLPYKYNPEVGIRLNLLLLSSSDNLASITLSSSSSYRSTFLYNVDDNKSTLLDSTLDMSVVSEKNYKWYMLAYIFLTTVGMALLFIHFFKGEFEDNIAIGIIASVLGAYLLGMLGALKTAPVILLLVAIIGWVLYFLDCLKNNVVFYERIDSSVIIWCVLLVVLFVFISHKYIGDPDSIFYISKSKYMYWTDSLAYSLSYAFFLPVLGYIYTSQNGFFSENILLLAIKIYEFSLLFSYLNCIKVDNKRVRVLLKVILLGVCTIFAIAIHPSAYYTIMMDVPFAITLAYIIKNLYERGFGKEKFIRIICGSIALVMIKRAGIPAVLVIAIIMAMHSLRFCGQEKKIERKYILALFLMLVICVFVDKAIAVYSTHAEEKTQIEAASEYIYAGTTNQSAGMAEMTYVSNGVSSNGGMGSFDIEVVKKLFYAFMSYEVYFGMSYVEVLGVIFLVAALTWLIVKDANAFFFLRNIVELLLASVLYYGVICYKYLFAIEKDNQYKLNAYDRYAVHFIGAVAIYEAIYLIKTFSSRYLENGEWNKLIVIALVVMVSACMKVDFLSICDWIDSDYTLIENSKDGLDNMLSIYSGYGHHIATYVADGSFDEYSYYSKRVNIECWNVPVYSNQDSIITADMADDYAQYLYDNAEYFYLINYDTPFIENVGRYFKNGIDDIKRHSLYYVEKGSDGSIALDYLGQVPLSDGVLRSPDGKAKLWE